VVEPLICPRCSAPVLQGHAFCGICGAPLPDATDPGPVPIETDATSDALATDTGAGTGRGGARPRGKASRGAAEQTASPEATAALTEPEWQFSAVAAAAEPQVATDQSEPPAAESAAVAAEPAVAAAATADAAAAEPDAIDPRLAALGLLADPAPEPEPEPQAEPEPQPEPVPFAAAPAEAEEAPVPAAWPAPVARPFLPPAVVEFEQPTAELPDEPPVRVAGGYLPPSDDVVSSWALQPSSAGSTGRAIGASLMSLSVGAVPATSMEDRAVADTDISAQRSVFAGSSQFGTPAAMPSDQIATAAPAPAPAPAAQAATTPVAATVAADATPSQAVPVDRPKESLQELVAFGLVAGGAVVGIASLLLPWGNSIDGAGIGINAAAHGSPNEMGWWMYATGPLIALSALVLGAASGSDRAKLRVPKLASIIGQVTDMILPMILGGLYLGVVLMAVTYPWGFGAGVLVMLLGAGLLIAGAVVTLFNPAEASPKPE